ncbi:MAG: DUF4249 domain-containing protein [Ignavibacteriales bacterium]|nr:DUF4249 domain-containing protein [Ignavibacteriales bacterium]
MKNRSLFHGIIKTIIFLMISLFSISCEKIISVDLNSTAPQLVIEASISDQPGPYYVKLSRTVNFDQTNFFPAVSEAKIVINDDSGNSDSLIETSPGLYKTSVIQGVPGRTYSISITTGGYKYTAVSTMPPPVDVDSLNIETQSFGPNKMKFVDVHFRDSGNVKNYYRFVEVKNGVPQNFIFLFDDRLHDGGPVTSSLVAEEDTLNSGDSVYVLLQCIDKNVFDYFRTIRQASGDPGPQAPSPANPLSNFTGGALGYFSAYAVRSRLIIIP